ncbi:type II toxin-antitoxin system YoeB family toxin [Marinococcus luteus]
MSTGKPEKLKRNSGGFYSHRIDIEHQLV